MEDNPYQAPAFAEPPVSSTSAANDREFRAFVGRKADYYLRKWSDALGGYGRARGFNWAAFFLSVLWLPYRKMYRITLILFGILVAETILEEFAAGAGVASERAITTIDRVTGLVIAIICGANGNSWYRAHAQRQIGRIRALGLEGDGYYKELAQRGGTNVLGSVGLFLLFVLAAALLSVGIEFLFPDG